MTALGIALLLLGAVLLVAEAHVPGGVLGTAGVGAVLVGVFLTVTASGAATALALPIALGVALASASFVALAAGRVIRARRARVRVGPERLIGRLGVVRRSPRPFGQVLVDGALWRARASDGDPDVPALDEDEAVVVERVDGLTLSVRRAEEWELLP